MGESAGSWGELVERDPELAGVWDTYDRLPDPGENDVLDSFVERKHIDIASLVRVGARLSDYRVLVFAGNGCLKYRNMETGQRWTSGTLDRFKLVPGRQRDHGTVIVAEGESDGARLSMLYPDADVAILPGGAKRLTRGMVEQLLPYARVLASYDVGDPDGAGDIGWAKLSEHVPQAVRFNAPGVNDWCDYEGDPPPLPAPSEDKREIVGTIIFEPIDDLLDNGVPDPEVLLDDLLYAEGVHLVSGHPGCGKTTIVQHMALMAMDEGRHCAWLDYEGGRLATVRRLLAEGADIEVVRELFHYAGWPVDAEDHLADIAQRWPGSLVVLDSLSKALASAGISENENDEVTKWAVKVVKSCKENGMPIVIIDHITKAGTDSDYSRGAGSKLADVDVHWRVLKVEDFNRTKSGLITLKQKKDREGYFPFSTWWNVGDGDGKLTITQTDGPSNDPDDPDAPAI